MGVPIQDKYLLLALAGPNMTVSANH